MKIPGIVPNATFFYKAPLGRKKKLGAPDEKSKELPQMQLFSIGLKKRVKCKILSQRIFHFKLEKFKIISDEMCKYYIKCDVDLVTQVYPYKLR